MTQESNVTDRQRGCSRFQMERLEYGQSSMVKEKTNCKGTDADRVVCVMVRNLLICLVFFNEIRSKVIS